MAADSPVRFIDAFDDDLDLGEAGFHRSRPKATGRPGYDPGDMLKLYLYGYLNRVRSSRRLEAEATRNLELIWLLRRAAAGLQDHRRLSAGQSGRPSRLVFRQPSCVLCRELDLFGRELLAVDGTRLKAVNNPGPQLLPRATLARYIACETADAELDEVSGRAGRRSTAARMSGIRLARGSRHLGRRRSSGLRERRERRRRRCWRSWIGPGARARSR